MESANRKKEYLALLHARIDRADSSVRTAEVELETALRDLAPLAAGDDAMITQALERCFDKLRVARQHVSDLRQVLAKV